MNKNIVCLLVALLVLTLSSPVMAQMPAGDNCDLVRTQIVEEVSATAVAEMMSTLTAMYDLVPKGQATPTPSTGAPVPTATLATAGDKASYDGQYPADGFEVKAGQSFDISWYLLNTGSTTWTTDYSLRYFTGTNFTKPGKPRFNLNAEVAPNTVGTCSIDAVAPTKPGQYQMSMVLGNENDENFFLVDITINVIL